MRPFDPSGTERLLVRATNWVGDAVMSIPALRAIRRSFPKARISLLARAWVQDVYSAVDFVDEVLVYDHTGIHRGAAGRLRLVSELKGRRFDAAILLQNALEAALIVWLAGIPCRIGYARDGRSLLLTHACKIDPDVRRVHQAYYYLDILSGVGLLEPRLWCRREYPLSIDIGVREGDQAAARELLRANGVKPGQIVIGLNPGASYGGAKRWFPDRYAAVADALAAAHDARVIIFGSRAERPIANDVSARMTHRPIVAAGGTTLGQLMGLVRECSLLITNDSGPMHLAAALNVPQLAIFGSTSEIATGPLSPHAEVIKEPAECNPCFLRECPTDFHCMTRITVERVLSSAGRKLRDCRGFRP
jgi:heptosyltransferase II